MTESINSAHHKQIKFNKGEYQRKNGTFAYRWMDECGIRHSIYAPTIEVLRQKERDVEQKSRDRIKTENRFITLNQIYTRWS